MFTSPRALSLGMVCLLLFAPGTNADDDWPQWRGPRQDGVSLETGLSASWPEGGPPELWRIPLGAGFSAVSVVGDRAYTMYGTETEEFVVCLDVADGSTVWKTLSGDLLEESYGNGPRATPTLDDGCVYSLGGTGSLLCLDAATGEKIWGLNVLEKFAAENADYGLSASPVVSGKMLLVVVGGPDGKSLAALDKKSGQVLWTGLSDKAGYSTPLPIEVDGTPIIVVLTAEAVVAVSPDDGREFWRRPWKTSMDANVATPIFSGNQLFISTGYSTGCAMFKLSAPGGTAAMEELWASMDMKNYFSTSVLVDGHLYGFNNTMLSCMNFQTGEATWRQRGFNKGSLMFADGKLIVLGERGTLALVEASPEEYKELATLEIFDGRTWTVPTLAGGRLFLRNDQELICLSLKP